MKAVLWTAYGPPEVFRIGELPKPQPKEKEVLIKIKCATVTLGDCELRKFQFMAWLWLPMRLFTGIFKPRLKVLGQEFSGVIEQVGSKVTKYKAGDEVFGPTDMKMGAYAEYKCLPEKHAMSIKPAQISFKDAATVATGGINGLHFVTKAGVKEGEEVLINGAGGSIGTYAVQIAKLKGARITAVDSDIKLDMLTSIGADHVIDYKKEDFSRSDKKYDVIIDIVGSANYSRCVNALKPNGRFVLGNPTFRGMLRAPFTGSEGKKVLFEFAGYKPAYFNYLKKLMEEGRIKPAIDKVFSIDQIVAAHQYVEDGLKKGNVVINIE